MKKTFATIISVILITPAAVFAYPFGGQIGQIIFCYNNAIYTAVGPPRGGPFIWTPSTQTFQFGPPSHSGQWLLGLAAPPYYCLVSIQPIIVWAGILMTMEGSSGPAAPGVPGGGSSNFSSGPSTVGNPLGGTTQPTAIGHVVVSEVYYQADAQHGGATADEWIEIYNGTSATVDLSHWTVRTAASSQTIQNGTTLGPSQYLVLAGTTNVRAIWTIPSSAQVIAFTSPFPGFSATGDAVILQNSSGSNVDAVSWGTNVSAFSPSVPTVALGHSIVRKTLSVDTDSASDWIDTSAPTPGR